MEIGGESDGIMQDCSKRGGGVPQEALNEIWTYIFNKDHPVKSYYISDDSTNPASVFGMGTWSLVAKDRFLIGAGSSYAVGSTGGEATHRLAVNEIPAHYHDQSIGSSLMVTGGGSWADDTQTYGEYVTGTSKTTTYKQKTTNTGGGAAHNNIPPYYATYIWRRTA
jgi:hypothetical protein